MFELSKYFFLSNSFASVPLLEAESLVIPTTLITQGLIFAKMFNWRKEILFAFQDFCQIIFFFEGKFKEKKLVIIISVIFHIITITFQNKHTIIQTLPKSSSFPFSFMFYHTRIIHSHYKNFHNTNLWFQTKNTEKNWIIKTWTTI